MTSYSIVHDATAHHECGINFVGRMLVSVINHRKSSKREVFFSKTKNLLLKRRFL